jgi:hypothetical protein
LELALFFQNLVGKSLNNKGISANWPNELAAETHTAGIWIVWGTGGNGKNADTSSDDFVLRGGRGDLCGCSCTGEDEDDGEGTNDMFHKEIPRKLYLLKKFSLDNQMR